MKKLFLFLALFVSIVSCTTTSYVNDDVYYKRVKNETKDTTNEYSQRYYVVYPVGTPTPENFLFNEGLYDLNIDESVTFIYYRSSYSWTWGFTPYYYYNPYNFYSPYYSYNLFYWDYYYGYPHWNNHYYYDNHHHYNNNYYYGRRESHNGTSIKPRGQKIDLSQKQNQDKRGINNPNTQNKRIIDQKPVQRIEKPIQRSEKPKVYVPNQNRQIKSTREYVKPTNTYKQESRQQPIKQYKPSNNQPVRKSEYKPSVKSSSPRNYSPSRSYSPRSGGGGKVSGGRK